MHSELAEGLARYTLVPETIFAYRFSEGRGWLLEAWECTKEEVLEETSLAGWSLDDLQVLREHKIVKGLNGYFLLDVALSQHWLRDLAMDHWVPMAHCLTASDEEPTAAGVAVSLEIGRESCRERVCPYVEISVVAVPFKKKTIHNTQ